MYTCISEDLPCFWFCPAVQISVLSFYVYPWQDVFMLWKVAVFVERSYMLTTAMDHYLTPCGECQCWNQGSAVYFINVLCCTPESHRSDRSLSPRLQWSIFACWQGNAGHIGIHSVSCFYQLWSSFKMIIMRAGYHLIYFMLALTKLSGDLKKNLWFLVQPRTI